MMDAILEPNIEIVVFMTSAQIGKTELLGNVLAHHMIYRPGPIMAMHPTVEMGQIWSKNFFSPMVRDTPCLKGLFSDKSIGDLSKTIMHKKFPGGHVIIVGANSPVGLSAQPIGFLLVDEADRMPEEVGVEGDPLFLAIMRTTAFMDRKIVLASTPTVEGRSRIQKAFLETDQRHYFVQCQDCGEFFTLDFDRLKWDENDATSVHYICDFCEDEIAPAKRDSMVAGGHWRASAISKRKAGFHIDEMCSPWVTWEKMVEKYLAAKDDPIRLKSWVNTSRGLPYEEKTEKIDAAVLLEHRQAYGGLPDGVKVITAGVDVHKFNVMVEVVGWGENYESWSLDYHTVHGDTLKPAVWEELTQYLDAHFGSLQIRSTAVDAGYRPDAVRRFVSKTPRAYAVIGIPGWGKPTIELQRGKAVKHHHPFRKVGVNDVKVNVYDRLRVDEPGPGFCHFPDHYDHSYFSHFESEQIVTKLKNGHPLRVWDKKPGTKNHYFDCRVYATAALAICGSDLESLIVACENERRVPEPSARAGGGYLGLQGGGKWVS